MNLKSCIIILLFLLPVTGCITQFIPETDETQELVVVEGLITDQDEANIILLSKTMPLGKKSIRKPLKGCSVIVSDNKGNNHQLIESAPGTYSTVKGVFKGVPGRIYTLKIFTGSSTSNHYSYRSVPMEMKPVPPLD